MIIVPRLRIAPLWLRVILLMASAALLIGLVGLGTAAIGGRFELTENGRQLVVPLALSLLGLLSWVLALPRLGLKTGRVVASKAVNGLIALCGSLFAMFACEELVTAFDDAGLVALLDVPLMLVAVLSIVLGAWCAVAGTGNLLRSNHGVPR
ncbi:hypothetical protein [Desulforhabdus sp. TSK]|uniref:hypothetical protein n=1 Tax=Desulforhabdus sp. TSK TaxID=2925014 RepID=UPI001FC7CD73|nr:hypothetical protein [Desulforhabdus sp. TSK]GKT07545.1 hypothetical protein DSTSK_08500 [Desulforhabdus sp. TSK]